MSYITLKQSEYNNALSIISSVSKSPFRLVESEKDEYLKDILEAIGFEEFLISE